MSESITTYWGVVLGAVTMGLSCGTGCSPAISVFLSSYVVHAGGDTRKSAAAFGSFFLGKAGSILLVCTVAALAGTAIVGELGYFGTYSIDFLMPLFLTISGAYMIWKSWKTWQGDRCGGCHSCGQGSGLSAMSPLLGGFVYGLTPCAPLVLLVGYSVSLPLWQALVLAVVFSVACMLSPLLLMMVIMKLISVKMQREVPKFFVAVRFGMSVAVFMIGLLQFKNL